MSTSSRLPKLTRFMRWITSQSTQANRPLKRSLPKSATAADRALLAAIDEAAERLGNTRTVCRNSYLHPAVPRAHLEGALLEAWRASRSTPRMSRAERATLRVLQEQALT